MRQDRAGYHQSNAMAGLKCKADAKPIKHRMQRKTSRAQKTLGRIWRAAPSGEQAGEKPIKNKSRRDGGDQAAQAQRIQTQNKRLRDKIEQRHTQNRTGAETQNRGDLALE